MFSISIEFGHSKVEWEEKFSNNDELWDFAYDELFDGTIDPIPNAVYWFIDGRLYETE